MLAKLFKYFNKNFKIIKIFPQKPTARCPVSAIVMIDGHKKYVVIAKTDIQKFYLERSIEKQREFYDDFSPYFQFNFPDDFGNLDGFAYAIYPYIENTKWCNDNRPIEIMEKIYKQHAKTYKMTPGLLTKIQADFLSGWPKQFHEQIKKLPRYAEYFDYIAKQKSIKVYRGHCDYAVNNILDDGKNLWLMDFEFSKNFQPIGHDLHDYRRTCYPAQYQPLFICKLRENLIDDINDVADARYRVDNNTSNAKKKQESLIKTLLRRYKKLS